MATVGQWRARKTWANVLAAILLVLPLAASVLCSIAFARAVAQPDGTLSLIGWWTALITTAVTCAWLTERLTQRFVPLVVLLRMAMVFPDEAPSRMGVALRTGSARMLERQLATAGMADDDLKAASERILMLAAALNAHDRHTRGHSERVRAYAEIIAEEAGVEEHDRALLRWGALLHDIGKVTIPEAILNKTDPLTDDEWHLVRRHPIEGMRLIEPLLSWLGSWSKTVIEHHEKWDGSGYPIGLAGRDIGLGARIVAVADTFDAMTTERSYGRVLSVQQAREEIVAMAGKQFDPMVVRAFLRLSMNRLRGILGVAGWLAAAPLSGGMERYGRPATATLAAIVIAFATLGQTVASEATDALVEVAGITIDAVEETGTASGLAAPVIATTGIPAAVLGQDAPPPATSPTTAVAAPPATTATTTPIGLDQPAPAPSTTTTTTTAPPSTPDAPPQPTTTTTPAPPATATDDALMVLEDTTATVDLAANDDVGVVVEVKIVEVPHMATWTLSGSMLTYSPRPDRFGTDRAGYRICGTLGCAEASLAITVVPVNDSPATVADRYATAWDTPITLDPLGNDTDADGDLLTIGAIEAPDNGTLSGLTYTPQAGFEGAVVFDYTACDAGGLCTTGSIEIWVSPPPLELASSDTFVIERPGAVFLDVTANDQPADSMTIVEWPAHGELTLIGQWRLRYKPDQGFIGTDQFTYRLCRANGVCQDATVLVDVR